MKISPTPLWSFAAEKAWSSFSSASTKPSTKHSPSVSLLIRSIADRWSLRLHARQCGPLRTVTNLLMLDQQAIIKEIDDVLASCEGVAGPSECTRALTAMVSAIRRLAPPGTTYANSVKGFEDTIR